MIDLRGIPFTLHEPGEGVSDGIRRSGDFYEADILDYLREHHPNHHSIVDAGANIGNHTAFFAVNLNHLHIYAFEPVPANYALLKANTLPYPTVRTYQVALSDRPGTLRMRPNPRNMGASRVTKKGPIEVGAITLDTLALRNLTLLKIDVENHEAAVIRGAIETIARCHPLVLIEDWSFGVKSATLLPGYELEKAWPERFTYLYRWAG